jgi:uncharacterized protein
MATIMITGGTGMIGTALTKELVNRDHDVIILTRDPSGLKAARGSSYAQWDLHNQTINKEAVERADIIVHLAGANLGKGRWTDKRKKEIVDSRVKSGQLIIKALKEIPNKVKAVISASAIGYYGADPQIPNPKPFTESDPPSNDFLGSLVQQWENTISRSTALGKRLVILRSGIVMSREGGAYPEFKKPLRFGLAAVLGSGRQIVSWITIDDLVRLYTEAIENENLNGIYNAVAPEPVCNRDLIFSIAKKQSFQVPFHVPAFLLKTLLGEMSIEVLKSTTVSAEKIRQQGFHFLYPTIEQAIRKLEAS